MFKKLTTGFLVVIFAFSLVLTGCNDSDNDDKTTSQTEKDILGSWSVTTSGQGWEESNAITFLDNKTFSSKDTEKWDGGSYEFTTEGTWRTTEGIIYLTFTKVSDPDDAEEMLNKEFPCYYFITSNGKLAISNERQVLVRDGQGEGLVGEWKSYGEDEEDEEDYCLFLSIYDDKTMDYENTCEGGQEYDQFSYKTDGDKFMIYQKDTDNIIKTDFYKLVNNDLLFMAGSKNVLSKQE